MLPVSPRITMVHDCTKLCLTDKSSASQSSLLGVYLSPPFNRRAKKQGIQSALDVPASSSSSPQYQALNSLSIYPWYAQFCFRVSCRALHSYNPNSYSSLASLCTSEASFLCHHGYHCQTSFRYFDRCCCAFSDANQWCASRLFAISSYAIRYCTDSEGHSHWGTLPTPKWPHFLTNNVGLDRELWWNLLTSPADGERLSMGHKKPV